MAVPSERVQRRVLVDFRSDARDVFAALREIPESLPLAEKQDSERLQAALVLPARGSAADLEERLRLARADWRDALVAADLAGDDWKQKLDAELGPGMARRSRVWAFLKRRAGTIALLALLVQPLGWALLVLQWGTARNMAGGCPFGGTCLDEGTPGPLLVGWVVLPLVELLVGVTLWCVLCDELRHRTDPLWIPPRPIAWTFITVTAILLAADAQSIYLVRFTAETTPTQARHAEHVIVNATAVDIAIAATFIVLRVILSRRGRPAISRRA